ncbi:RNA pseudouridine synthase [Oceanispirochaeta sp. M2]|uniref:RluA family pseudouridine synthase n=2 Tax=Oceanispirochaeta TaxID=2035349 RepID=UPI000E098F42|nr:RNA pseudouridine synthase [Oceanispirochaeta sp. M1]MBF9018492.1 RNA pseudouridine synthase [Oceanispirochaeta sp. M2]NPD74899.1 RNA pseudouridine synthase [Oceanispirochaeta sp. M1]RDG29254.1 RNA pseudouridine synthase [Oceanispirochaeta sp. M1]
MDSERVLYEDNHLIIVNKLCSEIVQGDKTGDTTLAESVQAFIKKRDKKPGNVFLGITHRLDRPTSGIVIFAKTSKALSRMNKLFREHGVKKSYWAVLQSSPEEGEARLVDYLWRDKIKNRSYVCDESKKDAKKAILSYTIICRYKNYVLADIDLETGRHHQIRAQFSSLGCSIKGDLKYGAKQSNPGGGIHLHARRVSFIHPVSAESINVTAAVPRDDILWQDMEEKVLRGDSQTGE